jgi:hypothetical protein
LIYLLSHDLKFQDSPTIIKADIRQIIKWD